MLRVLLLTSVLLLSLPRPEVSAAGLPAVPGQLLLRADTLQHEQSADVITASGKVELEWGGAKLYAAMMKYYRDQGVVEASGGFRLLKDGDLLAGDRARLQLESQTGVVTNGSIFIKKNNLRLSGKSIEKNGDQEYRLGGGRITSCDGDKPGWSFRVNELKLTVDDFAFGKSAFFYLGEVPVFWFPYLLFPAKIERQSGFLIPKVGHSAKKGAFLEVPYYWAVTPSQDITATLDLETERGVGLGLEQRYLGTGKGQGVSRGFLIYDWKQERFRGDLELKQQVNFGDNSYWRADLNLALDRDFYRDYGTSNGDYNRQYLGTAAFLSHRVASNLATVGVDYLKDLDAPNNSTTLQKLPYVTLAGSGERIAATPFYYAFASSLTHFERERGSRGERLLLAPELTMQGALGGALNGRAKVGYYLLGYNAEEAGAGNGLSSTGVLQASAAVRSGVSRVYEASVGGFSRFRHLLLPEASYRVTEKRSLHNTPFFDFDDRPAGGQLLTLSLDNIVTGRSDRGDTASYRDLLRLNISQGYQLSGERRDLLLLVDYGRPFTDTTLLAELLPFPDWRLFTDNRISPYNGHVTNASLGVEVGRPAGSRALLGYHHAEAKLDYIEGRVAYADFRPYLLTAAARYSFDRPGFLETLYSLEYKHQCWGLLLSYRDRLDNKELTVTFSLSGLGTFKLL